VHIADPPETRPMPGCAAPAGLSELADRDRLSGDQRSLPLLRLRYCAVTYSASLSRSYPCASCGQPSSACVDGVWLHLACPSPEDVSTSAPGTRPAGQRKYPMLSARDCADGAARTAAGEWQALAPALAARRRMRLSLNGSRSYPRKHDTALTTELPSVPAAIYIYSGLGDTRLLAADFDVSRAARRGADDPAAQVAADARGFTELIQRCGGRVFSDGSPNGGQHAYVLWAAPIGYDEMRRVAMALARRFMSLDPKPMTGRRHGIIRPPGSRHRSGGFQALLSPLSHARRCIDEPNIAATWQSLVQALAPELAAVDAADAPLPPFDTGHPDPSARAAVDPSGAPWLPRPGGPLPHLRADLELSAVTGWWDAARYDSPSEARFAILCSAAARGWQLSDLAARIRSGAWQGLASFYTRYRTDAQRTRALTADWRKAVRKAGGAKSGHAGHTSGNQHAGRPPPRVAPSPRTDLRRWDCAFRAVERSRWPGPHGITTRLVVRALAAAAQMRGSMVIDFGTRSLGLLAGVDHSTVAQVLRELRAEHDPFVVLEECHHGIRADKYRLVIPASCSVAAAWRRWRPGRFGVHPAFRVLGGAAALVCEQLTAEPVRALDLPLLTGLSPSTVSMALTRLAEHGIAVRGPGGWQRGPARLDEVAEILDVPELLARIQARNRDQRRSWQACLAHLPAEPPEVCADDADEEHLPEPPACPADEPATAAPARAPPAPLHPAAATRTGQPATRPEADGSARVPGAATAEAIPA
jgi:DNA-binding transcriptional ArsR family regulator